MGYTRTPLMRHQAEFLDRLQQPDHVYGYANFSDPGTGKTLGFIAALNWLRTQHPTLRVVIVCPKILIDMWADTLAAESSNHAWTVGTPRMKRLPSNMNCYILNYERLVAAQDLLKRYRPMVILLDEAHRIKNPTARCTKVLKKIPTTYRWIATGTPAANNPLDVWSLIDFMRPGWLHKTFSHFRNYYADVYYGAGYPKVNGYKNLDELQARVSQYSYRICRDDCLDLPGETWQHLTYPLTAVERRSYDALAKHLVAELSAQEYVTVDTALQKLLRLQEMTSGFTRGAQALDDHQPVGLRWIGTARIDAAMELLDSMAHERVVIFARFLPEVEVLLNRLGATGRAITSTTPDAQRQRNLEWFQQTPGARLIGTYGTISEGVNQLTCASSMLFLSHTFSLTQRDQAAARIYRKGQARKVTYYSLVCQETVDQVIVAAYQNKALLNAKVTPQSMWQLVQGVAV